MSLPRITSHLHKLWLGTSWVTLFSSLDLGLFHKSFQQISKPTSGSHTHPVVMISTAHCLLTGRNLSFSLFWASSLHLTPLGPTRRKAWTVTLHLPYSWLYQCLPHSCFNHPFSTVKCPTVFTHSLWWRYVLSLSDHRLHSPSLYLFQVYYTL